MINTVVKRDGTVEKFDPSKLTKWAEWASVVGVDWFAVASEAYGRCHDGTTTAELHDALVKVCIDLETEASMKMAGRLLIGDLYKRVFGGNELPDLKTYVRKMISEGFYADQGYTDADLDYLGTVIDHSADFDLTSTQVMQDIQKYLISDITTRQPKETPQFALMRQAMGAHHIQPDDRKLNDVVLMYQDLKAGWVNTPTPNKTNLGTEKKGLASCCISTATDNLKSIEAQNHIYWEMTAASAGQGGYLQTRSIGDKIRGGVIKHGGKLPYFRLQEAETKANLQGSRGGALTTYLNALDPEIFVLLAMRNPTTVVDKRVDGIDNCFMFNESFIKRAFYNKDWLLISYYDAPDLWDAFFEIDTARFDALMDEYIKSGKGEVIKAKALLKKHIIEDEVSGRQYEFNVTEANRHTSYKDRIYSSNLCVSGDTKIMTKQGYITIGDNEGKDVEVWNGQEWSSTTIVKTGTDQQLIKVVTDSGQELECTPYHKFYKAIGYTNKVEEVRAVDLVPGDKLIKFDLPVISGDKVLSEPWANGFLSGDGSDDGVSKTLFFYHEKRSMLPLVEHLITHHRKHDEQNRDVVKVKGLGPKFFVPDASYTVESRVNWFGGLIDADGCALRNGKTESIQLSSVNKQFMLEVQLMLQTVGVHSKLKQANAGGMRLMPDGKGGQKEYMCQPLYRLLIGNTGVNTLFAHGMVTHRIKTEGNVPNRAADKFIKIVSVTDEGKRGDTYCFTEPKRHMGMFNGILTGQCLEAIFPTAPFKHITDLYETDPDVIDNMEGEVGICNLAAMPVGRFSADKHGELAYRTLLMVDNVIEQGEFPLPQVTYTSKARRSVGIGITNLAYAMAKEGVTYDSPEGKAFCHRLAELHLFSLLKASVQLAKEKGKCKWFDRTKYADGWLPIDTYNKYVDKITDQPLLQDWEWLRGEIKKYGLRHSSLVNHMPVESSSVRNGDTNGLYPIRRGVVVKTSGNTKLIFMPPEYERLKDKYQLAWDIDHDDLVEVYAIFQKFADQGISADVYHKYEAGKDKKVSLKLKMHQFFYRQRVGLKSRYYSNTATGITETEQENACGSGGCTL